MIESRGKDLATRKKALCRQVIRSKLDFRMCGRKLLESTADLAAGHSSWPSRSKRSALQNRGSRVNLSLYTCVCVCCGGRKKAPAPIAYRSAGCPPRDAIAPSDYTRHAVGIYTECSAVFSVLVSERVCCRCS